MFGFGKKDKFEGKKVYSVGVRLHYPDGDTAFCCYEICASSQSAAESKAKSLASRESAIEDGYSRVSYETYVRFDSGKFVDGCFDYEV
jgi:hypothetical protein